MFLSLRGLCEDDIFKIRALTLPFLAQQDIARVRCISLFFRRASVAYWRACAQKAREYLAWYAHAGDFHDYPEK